MHKKSALNCFHTFAVEGTKTSFCRCSSSATFQELSRKKKENFRPQHQTLHKGKPTTSSVASIEQRRLGFFLFFGKTGLLYCIPSSLLPRPPSRRKLNLHHLLLRFSHNISLSRLKNEALLFRPLSTGKKGEQRPKVIWSLFWRYIELPTFFFFLFFPHGRSR